jgi:hypothetical protein
MPPIFILDWKAIKSIIQKDEITEKTSHTLV